MSQLLSLEGSSVNSEIIPLDSVPNNNAIELLTSFSYGTVDANVNIIISNENAFVIEHKMLGEMDDIKSSVDDDMLDALKEIGSNITGAIANSINAQGDDSLTGVKFTVNAIEAKDEITTSEFESVFKIVVNSDSSNFEIYLLLDSEINNLFNNLTNDVPSTSGVEQSNICDENLDNLSLLMDVELDVSVRIGSKTMLLKDIVKLDLGDVIELDQLVNNPLDILVNGVKIADGEAVVVGGNFAVKIKTMGSKKDRLSSLRIAS